MLLQKYTCKGNPFAFGEVFRLCRLPCQEVGAALQEHSSRVLLLVATVFSLQPSSVALEEGWNAVLGDSSILALSVFCLEGLKRCVDFWSCK